MSEDERPGEEEGQEELYASRDARRPAHWHALAADGVTVGFAGITSLGRVSLSVTTWR